MSQNRKGGLGRGLDALFGEDNIKMPEKTKTSVDNNKDVQQKIVKESDGSPLIIKRNLIQPNPNQPRQDFESESAKQALEELATSIENYGIIQPLTVRKEGPLYIIIAGERRWRAAELAGLDEVPVYVKDCSEQESDELSLIENIQRSDLNPVEEALSYEKLIDKYSYTQEKLAEKVGKSRSAITNALRILKLDTEVTELIKNGQISAGHARALLSIEDSEIQKKLAKRVIDEKLNVRELEQITRAYEMQQAKKTNTEEKTNTDVKTDTKKTTTAMTDDNMKQMVNVFEITMKAKLGTKVKVNPKNEESGKIEINYYSMNDFNRLADILTAIQG